MAVWTCWMPKDGRHEFQTIKLHYGAHIEVGFACGSMHTALWCWQQDMERLCRCRRRQQDRCREFETEGKYEDRETAMMTNERRWTKQRANGWRQSSSRCCILGLEFGDWRFGDCLEIARATMFGPATGNLVSYAEGIGGKVAGDWSWPLNSKHWRSLEYMEPSHTTYKRSNRTYLNTASD